MGMKKEVWEMEAHTNKTFIMKILQYIQLNGQQRKDAIVKMAALSKKLNFAVFGQWGEQGIADAIAQDKNPDSIFMFDEIDEEQVDVIYRENI